MVRIVIPFPDIDIFIGFDTVVVPTYMSITLVKRRSYCYPQAADLLARQSPKNVLRGLNPSALAKDSNT